MDTPQMSPILQPPVAPVRQKPHGPVKHFFTTLLFASLTLGVASVLYSFQASITHHPGNASTEALYESGNLDAALTKAEADAAASPESVPAAVALSLLYSQKAFITGDPSFSVKAEVEATRIIATAPTNAEGFRALGYAYEVEGRVGEAVLTYNKGLTFGPTNAELISYLGHAFDAQGKLADAQYSYERALSLDPTLVHAKVNLARLYVTLGTTESYAKAKTLAEEVLATSNQKFVTAETETVLGAALLGQGNFAEAGVHYTNALTLAPNSSNAALGLAWAEFYQLRGVTDKAVALTKMQNIFAHVKIALTADAANANAYYLAGLTNIFAGRNDTAKEILLYAKDTVIAVDPRLTASGKAELSTKITSTLATLK